MRRLSFALSLTTLVLFLTTGHSRAEVKAELVETRIIWDQGTHCTFTDLVRFKDRWYCVCREGQQTYSPDGVLRIISSADGVKWESLAAINSPTPNTGLHDPKLVVTPKGQLMLTALGSAPKLQSVQFARVAGNPGAFTRSAASAG